MKSWWESYMDAVDCWLVGKDTAHQDFGQCEAALPLFM